MRKYIPLHKHYNWISFWGAGHTRVVQERFIPGYSGYDQVILSGF